MPLVTTLRPVLPARCIEMPRPICRLSSFNRNRSVPTRPLGAPGILPRYEVVQDLTFIVDQDAWRDVLVEQRVAIKQHLAIHADQ